MTCPICGGPMGFSEASALGNCLNCDGESRPGDWLPFAILATLILSLALLACGVA